MSKPMNEIEIERAYNAALRGTRLEIEAARILLGDAPSWEEEGKRGREWTSALKQRLGIEMEAEMKIARRRIRHFHNWQYNKNQGEEESREAEAYWYQMR